MYSFQIFGHLTSSTFAAQVPSMAPRGPARCRQPLPQRPTGVTLLARSASHSTQFHIIAATLRLISAFLAYFWREGQYLFAFCKVFPVNIPPPAPRTSAYGHISEVNSTEDKSSRDSLPDLKPLQLLQRSRRFFSSLQGIYSFTDSGRCRTSTTTSRRAWLRCAPRCGTTIPNVALRAESIETEAVDCCRSKTSTVFQTVLSPPT